MAAPDDSDLIARLAEQEAAERSAAGAAIGDGDLSEAQARAREIVSSDQGEEMREGLQAMRDLSFSIGKAVPRVLINALIDAAKASDSKKKEWRRALDAEIGADQNSSAGCISVEIPASTAGEATTAYLLLDACGSGHDLDAELGKLFSKIPAARKPEILKHLSALVQLGRAAYGSVIESHGKLLRGICKKVPGEVVDLTKLGIAHSNTTFFLMHPALEDSRAGIFIRFGE